MKLKSRERVEQIFELMGGLENPHHTDTEKEEIRQQLSDIGIVHLGGNNFVEKEVQDGTY